MNKISIPEDIDVTKNIIGHLRMIDKKLNALADYLNVVYGIEYKENTTEITIKEVKNDYRSHSSRLCS